MILIGLDSDELLYAMEYAFITVCWDLDTSMT